MVDEARKNWIPGVDELGRPERAHTQLTREHVQLLHDCQCTRAQVLDYASQVLNPAQLAKLNSDLDSYGGWPD